MTATELAISNWNQAMNIQTWNERCETHPQHSGIVTNRMIQDRMQEEIDELRGFLEQQAAAKPYAWITSNTGIIYKGEYAEFDAKREARLCKGTCKAIPLYLAAVPE